MEMLPEQGLGSGCSGQELHWLSQCLHFPKQIGAGLDLPAEFWALLEMTLQLYMQWIQNPVQLSSAHAG